MCFFFFQAEDGIRDLTVTGVQTCALPISASVRPEPGSYSPMRIQFSSNRTSVLPVVRITSESNPPRHASDRAPLVSGPLSTRSAINSQRAAQTKLPAQPTILTPPRDPSQGGLLLEDTPQVRRHAEEQLIAP